MSKALVYEWFPFPEVFIFWFGAMVGSFLNVVIYRLPVAMLALWPDENETPASSEDEIPADWGGRFRYAFQYWLSDTWWSLAYCWSEFGREAKTALHRLSWPSSHCSQCKMPIKAYDNIPILSWFLLLGRCRHCKQPFSFRYALNEIICGGLFLGIWYLAPTPLEFLFLTSLIGSLWAIFWIDFDQQLIFNVITYPSILMGIVYNLSKGTLSISFAGILLGYILLEGIVLLSIVAMGKEGMGGGDVKLAMLLGSWLGPQLLLVALALAFLLGSAVGVWLLWLRKSSRPFPFGPALVLGGIISLSIGEFLWTWYIKAVVAY